MARGRGRGALGLGAVAVLAVASGCTPRQPWRSELVSVNVAGTDSGNSRSSDPVVSAGGTLVVFASLASDLVANDVNGNWDVFVRDLTTGVTSLVSVDAAGTASADGGSMNATISADGTRVAFESTATNLSATPDTNGMFDVYVRDLTTGVTSLAATATDGTTSTSASIAPTFSPDGTKLAFVGSGLDPRDTTGGSIAPDVYVRDLETGVVDLVSVNAAGDGSGDGWSLDSGVFSPDGTRLAFTSQAANLVAGDANHESDLFVRDLAAGTTTLVSANVSGTGSGNTWTTDHGAFSPDGSSLTFTSTASDLVPTDTNGASDVFLRDLVAGTTSVVSANQAGTDTARGSVYYSSASSGPVFAPDGRHVAFISYASDFGPTDTDPNTDIYLRDLLTGTTTMVSTNADGSDSAGEWSHRPAFTSDSTKILFESGGNLGPRDTNGGNDVYVKDLTAGTVTLVSANADGSNSGNDISSNASISADGRTVAFQSRATDLGPTDSNSDTYDIYVATLREADVSVTVTPLSTVGAGGEVQLRIGVANHGPDDADDVAVAVVLPAEAQLAGADAGTGVCAAPNADRPEVVLCSVGDVAAGANAGATLTVAQAASGTVLAVVMSGAPDPDTTNNVVTQAVSP